MVELLKYTREQLVEEVQKKEASRLKLKEKLVVLTCCPASLAVLKLNYLAGADLAAGTAEGIVCEHSASPATEP